MTLEEMVKKEWRKIIDEIKKNKRKGIDTVITKHVYSNDNYVGNIDFYTNYQIFFYSPIQNPGIDMCGEIEEVKFGLLTCSFVSKNKEFILKLEYPITFIDPNKKVKSLNDFV